MAFGFDGRLYLNCNKLKVEDKVIDLFDDETTINKINHALLCLEK